jgi:signal peptidase II
VLALLLFSFAIVFVDQFVKVLVCAFLKPDGSLTVIDGLLYITYLENKGAAFGIFENARLFFIILTSAVIVALLFILKKTKIRSRLFLFAVALIIGGGIGNLIDRIFLGYVVDYIYVTFFPPICNFADYSVSLGVALLIVYLLFFHEKSGYAPK